MPEEIKEARIHPWVYYIAPINDRLYFSAFCKACRQYYTEVIPIDVWGAPLFSESHLPRYGCTPISEEF